MEKRAEGEMSGKIICPSILFEHLEVSVRLPPSVIHVHLGVSGFLGLVNQPAVHLEFCLCYCWRSSAGM